MAPDQKAGQGDPLAGEQEGQGQNGRGTLGGLSSDQATLDQDDSQSVYREIKEAREVVNTFPILAIEGYVVLWGSEEYCFTTKEVRSRLSSS